MAVLHRAQGIGPNNHTIPGTPAQLGNLRLVDTNTVTITALDDGSTNLSVNTVAHNLGFVPYVTAQMNGSSATGITGLVTNFLPGFSLLSVSGSGGSGGYIQFNDWIQVMADATNVYFYWIHPQS